MNTGGSGGEDNEEHKDSSVRVAREVCPNDNLKVLYNRAETGSNYMGFSDNQEDEDHSCKAIKTHLLDKAVDLRGSEVLEVNDEDSSLYLGLQSFMESNPQLQVNSP